MASLNHVPTSSKSLAVAQSINATSQIARRLHRIVEDESKPNPKILSSSGKKFCRICQQPYLNYQNMEWKWNLEVQEATGTK